MKNKLGFKTLFRLLGEIGNHKLPYYSALLGFCMVNGANGILIPIIMKIMIDAITRNDAVMLGQGITLAVLETVIACFLFIGAIYFFWKSVHRVSADMKIRMIRRVVHLPVSYFENRHSGDILSRITDDINNLYGALGWTLRDMLNICLTGLGSAVVMIILDYRFSILLFFLGIVSAIPNARAAARIKGISGKLQAEMGKITEKVSDLFAGHFIVKMFHIADRLDEKFMEHNEHARKLSVSRAVESSKLDTFNFMVSWISFGGVIALGAYLSVSSSVELGTVIAELNLIGNVNNMIRRLGSVVTSLQGSLAGVDRVFELMDSEREPESYPPAGESSPSSRYVIEMRNVKFTYDKEQVLKGVDMAVEASGIAALAGGSGGGKSTLVKLLLGYYPAETGTILINGRPICAYKLEELRKLIAYVPQDAYIFDGTIEENIRLGNANATVEEAIQAARAANAYAFIMEMPEKMQTRVGERGVRLSGGQRQRIAIARAILKDAPILILDEATSSLDSESEQLVQEALTALMKGRTSVVIAHRLSTIEKADIIYIVEGGRIIEQGSHRDLLERDGAYKNLFDCQFAS